MNIDYSRGLDKFDNKPDQRRCADFDEFQQAVLSDVSPRKGQAFICAPLRSGPHYQKPDKYPGNRTWRLKDHVLPRQFVAFDFDGFSSRAVFEDAREFMQRYHGFGYTTASHTAEQPRARVILLTSRPMSRAECVSVSDALEREIGRAVAPGEVRFDNSVYRGEQPIYTPVVGAETFVFDGDPVDVDAVLHGPALRRPRLDFGDLGNSYEEPGVVPQGERNSAVLAHIGHLRAHGEHEDAVVEKVRHFNTLKCQPPLDDAEVDDLLSRYPEQQNHRAPESGPADWPKPKALRSSLRPVPDFDLDLLPEVFKPHIADVSELMDTPPELLAVPLMVAAAATLGNGWCIAPKARDLSWKVTPVLWGAIIAPPGSKKTPCLNKALVPLRVIEERLAEDHRRNLQQYQADLLAYDTAMKKAKADAAKGLTVQNLPMKPECPEAERLMTNDTTYQKLGEIHHWSPRGVAVVQDELVGLLESMETKGQEGARAFYLSGWNGDSSYKVDRVGRPSNIINRLALFVLGGMQPDKLQQYVRDATQGGNRNDGLIQRFQLLVYPDMPTSWQLVDRPHDQQTADDALNAVLRLRELVPSDVGARSSLDGQYAYLQFADDAQHLFFSAMKGYETGARSPGVPSSIRSHFEKYPRLVAALALVIHLVDAGTGPVSLTATQKAVAWSKYLAQHALRVYGAESAAGDAAKALADKVRSGVLESGFTRRTLERKNWQGLSGIEDTTAALDALVEADWLRAETPGDGAGSRTQVYIINPRALAA